MKFVFLKSILRTSSTKKKRENVPFAFYQTIKVPLAFEVCALETWTFQDSAFEGLAQFCKVSAPSEKLANKLRQQDILT